MSCLTNIVLSLNPYSNGRYSRSFQFRSPKTLRKDSVLILILMEDTLEARQQTRQCYRSGSVLILILMEDTLEEILKDVLRSRN